MKSLTTPGHTPVGIIAAKSSVRLRRGRVLPAIAAALLLTAALGQAHAGRPPATADLEVQLDAPATSDINLPSTYSVTVTNLGQSRSGTINASVSFPLSNTSPQVFVLGSVTPLDQRCTVAGDTLNCSLASLRKNWSTTFLFSYSAPVSTKPLLVTASASANTADPVSNNNSSSSLPNLVYPARPISASSATIRGCNGRALTAFYECAQFPSSIMSFPVLLRADQSIDLGQPGYTGNWSQNPAKTSLKMEFFVDRGQGPIKVVDFNGWAINGANCFHGLSTFPQDLDYVSPYEVCLP